MSNFANKLKDLGQIQPRAEWQKATRVELLEQFDSLHEQKAGLFVSRKLIPSHPFSSLFHPLSSLSLKPVFITLVILAVIFGASWLIFRDLSYPLYLAEKGINKVIVFNAEKGTAPSQVEELSPTEIADRLEEKLVKIEKDLGSLPVQDNKEIIAFTFEAKKALEQAKEYLLEKNFTMALSKIEEGEELVNKAKQGTLPVLSPKHEITNPDFKIDIIKE